MSGIELRFWPPKLMNVLRILLFIACGAGLVRAQAPGGAAPAAKGAFDAQLQKLTRSAWTWETVKGQNAIKFEKDGTCVHTNFYGTFEFQKDDTVVIKLPRKHVLVFNFDKGEYSGYDPVLKQTITGTQTYQGTVVGPSKVPAPPAPSAPSATPAPVSATAFAAAAELVKVNRTNLVFVTTADGAGSGFIASYGTGTFLITNAHVAATTKGAMFNSLDNTQVPIGAPAVAVGHDIFRMALPPGGTPLHVMIGVDENATIGDEVVVLGNAEGAGVINTITGKIVGIGPNLVEVDAPFQPGNSGSPIIHVKTGKVIGVATYHTIRKYDSVTKQAVKDPVVRRFGYRLDTVKIWQPVNWQAFYAQAAEMEAIERLTNDLVAFLNDLSDGHVDRAAHTNPIIKNRINQWLDARAKRLSPRDAATADQSLLSFLRLTCQSDITAAQPRLTFDYFQRHLADQQRERTEIAGVFGKSIENLRQ